MAGQYRAGLWGWSVPPGSFISPNVKYEGGGGGTLGGGAGVGRGARKFRYSDIAAGKSIPPSYTWRTYSEEIYIASISTKHMDGSEL